jgi:hypothetical protein
MAMSAAVFGFFAVAAVAAVLMRPAYAREQPLEGTP